MAKTDDSRDRALHMVGLIHALNKGTVEAYRMSHPGSTATDKSCREMASRLKARHFPGDRAKDKERKAIRLIYFTILKRMSNADAWRTVSPWSIATDKSCREMASRLKAWYAGADVRAARSSDWLEDLFRRERQRRHRRHSPAGGDRKR